MKMIIYQVLPRLFANRNPAPVHNGNITVNGCGKLSAFTFAKLRKLRRMGFTHIWYTGLIEHATQTDYSEYGIPSDRPEWVKGLAGSPYAIKDYYNIDPDLADDVPHRMAEFEALVQRSHLANLKVIMDFVPNHVSLSNLNFDKQSYHYYPGSEQRVSDYGWSDTVKLNYDYRGTWDKMYAILKFWADKQVDGFRCDMAEMVPVEFWAWVISQLKRTYPRLIFIAEIYNPAQYRNYLHVGQFDYLYDKVGLYDTLREVIQGNKGADHISFCWQSVNDIQPKMLNFLENHDEQRLASLFFAANAQKGRPALVVAALMNTNPFMVYFGQELGESGMEEEGFSGRDGRTSIFDYWNLSVFRRPPTENRIKLRQYYIRILQLCNESQAFSQGAFFDLMYVNFGSEHFDCRRQYAFMRYHEDELWLIIANFDERAVDVQAFVPLHAFEYFGIVNCPVRKAKNILTDQECSPALRENTVYPVHIPALDAAIIRFQIEKKIDSGNGKEGLIFKNTQWSR